MATASRGGEEMTKIKEFFIEESKVNKGLMILVAIDEDDQKWVCAGDHWSPTYVRKYENAFDTKHSFTPNQITER
jgi:hypothetical protein